MYVFLPIKVFDNVVCLLYATAILFRLIRFIVFRVITYHIVYE